MTLALAVPGAVAPVAIAGFVGAAHVHAASAAITEFPIPTGASAPTAIATGSDGNLWFTENSGNNIGQITPSGTITEFAIPTASSAPQGITSGPDGNLWFTENAGNNIGQLTTAGVFTEFAIPTSNSQPYGITTGPDGNLWFTESNAGTIGRITTAGVITEFTGGIYRPQGITTGSDGNLWAADFGGGTLDQVTTAGTITAFGANRPEGDIASGSDGNLWFFDFNATPTAIASVTTSNTGFAEHATAHHVNGLTSGPNGAIWFTDNAGNVSEMSTSGAVTTFAIPTTTGNPLGITTGPDGNMWFTEGDGNSIGQLVIPSVCANAIATPSRSAINAGYPETGPGLTETVSLTVANCGTSPLPNVTTSTTTTPPAGCGAAPTLNEVSDPGLAAGSSTAPVTTSFAAPYCVGAYTVTSQVFSDATLVGSGTGTYADALGAVGVMGPTESRQVRQIVTGPDGNLWSLVGSGRYLARLTPTGVETQFLTPNSEFPDAIAAGPDGNIWVAENSNSFGFDIAKFTTSGVLRLLTPLPSGVRVQHMAPGPDGNVWMTETSPAQIGRITPDGKIKQFGGLPNDPNGIAAGPDGSLWFSVGGDIGRMTTSGNLTIFPVPTHGAGEIALGADGNMWFTEQSNNLIGRITPSGVVSEFPTGSNGRPQGIAQGGDGNMWYADIAAAPGGYHVGRITPAGVITEYPEDFRIAATPIYMASGPDGNVWLASLNAQRVLQIATGPTQSCSAVSLSTNPFNVSAGASETVATKIGNCASTPMTLKLATKTTPPIGCGTATTAKVNVPLGPRTGTTVASTFTTPSCTGTYKVQSTLTIGTTVVGKSSATYQVS